MITEFSATYFKTLRGVTLDLGRVNLFIGGNGAGKSNVLEAIGLASASVGQGLRPSDLQQRGIRLSPPELMKSAHRSQTLPKSFRFETQFQNGVSYKCSLTSTEKDPLLRFNTEVCHIGRKKQFGRGPNGANVLRETLPGNLEKHRGMWDQIKVAYSFDPVLEDTLSEFASYAIYTPQTDVLRGKKSGPLNTPPLGLHGEGLPTATQQMIRQAYRPSHSAGGDGGLEAFTVEALNLVFLPGWLDHVRVGRLRNQLTPQDLSVPREQMVYFIDKFMDLRRNTLSAYDSSEGTLFLLFIAVLISHRDSPRYFALDNVDNALNPSMTRRMLETLIALVDKVHTNQFAFGPKQVFLTSHNPTSLDAFDLFDDNHRIFVVSRNEKGHTLVDRLKPRDGMTRSDWSIAAKGRKLSELWLSDAIKGANSGVEL